MTRTRRAEVLEMTAAEILDEVQALTVERDREQAAAAHVIYLAVSQMFADGKSKTPFQKHWEALNNG